MHHPIEPQEGEAMAEEAAEAPEPQPEQEAPEATSEAPEEFDADRAKAKIAKANSEAANLRKRLKELEPLAKKAQELEERDKTEAQKLADKATKAEQRAASAEVQVLRYQVAAEKGVDFDLVEFLTGDNEDDLKAQADKLLAKLTPAKDDTTDTSEPDLKIEPSRRPRERMKSGAVPDAEPTETDPEKLAAQIPRRW